MRWIFCPSLSVGVIDLPDEQAHHLRDVLRMKEGEAVGAFDEGGLVGQGHIAEVSKKRVSLSIESVEPAKAGRVRLTVASALPKGARADWMIEKLSELGVNMFVPLITERSVVMGPGDGKVARWRRMAIEAAEQSGRAGVMRIEASRELDSAMTQAASGRAWHLSTGEKAKKMAEIVGGMEGDVTLFIGPEGGWTEQETAAFEERGIAGVRLTQTVLRIETAAIAAAALVQSA
jgi:16S rRNA (uracil1498-N3)-methyltransferase